MAPHDPPDDPLVDLLDDLEGQAEALYAAEREAEVADRSRAEYATVPLLARLVASLGEPVVLDVAGVGRVAGELRRVGRGWCLVREAAGEALVPLAAVAGAEGLSPRAVPEVAWSPLARLGLGSVLRRLADEATPCVLLTRTGARYEAVPLRVGADFLEVRTLGEQARGTVLPLAALAVVRSGPTADQP